MADKKKIDIDLTPEHHARVKQAKEFEAEKKKKRTAKNKVWTETVGTKIIQKTKTARGTYSKIIGRVKK